MFLSVAGSLSQGRCGMQGKPVLFVNMRLFCLLSGMNSRCDSHLGSKNVVIPMRTLKYVKATFIALFAPWRVCLIFSMETQNN